MCELLGMSANVPTDICFSFTGLMQRGGRTGPHRDGWGIAFYEADGYRAFHCSKPSAESEIARLVRSYPIKSHIVISHVRKANRGRVSLANTHPFSRELWGQQWSFAHNGQLKGIKKWPLRYYYPIGTTDSEHAFCWLLDRLRERFERRPRGSGALQRFVAARMSELNALGVFNCLLSDSRYLFAHCGNHLAWLTRCAPFGWASLVDTELAVDFGQETTPRDVVTVIATRPLTEDEDWTIMTPDSLRVFELGLVSA